MDIYQLIDSLMEYGKSKQIYNLLDYDYILNSLLKLFKLDDFKKVENHLSLSLDDILSNMLDYAIDKKLIENTTNSKDSFDTKIMGTLMPLPSTITNKFYELKNNESAKSATDYFYSLCKDVNYIRTSRIAKDIHFDYQSEYGTINISINMSKPEKDPNDIKKLLTLKKVSYPTCMLCHENVNYAGRIDFPSRENLRCIPVALDGQPYYIQYSPYSYFNEHLICFHKEHFNMKMDRGTIQSLVDFVSNFPFYFIGSNANLPIVGGSILNHHHYQGGLATLPMENAKETFIRNVDDVDVYKLYWPMSVIRIKSKYPAKIVDFATKIINSWSNYKNEKINIINQDKSGIHSTITPICRRKNGLYELDVVLRNNLTTDTRPLGLFHPQEKYWHIKKENIGLIEVMGLAILPSRLKHEMEIVKKYLLHLDLSTDEKTILEKHQKWADELSINNDITSENVDAIINDGIGNVFTNVLKDCAVFDDNHQDEFDDFILKI